MSNYKKIFNLLLILAAYGFLGYKILTYDNYAALFARFTCASFRQWVALCCCFALFPLNRLFESCKWRFLVHDIEPMDLMEAQRQVYYGTIAGFVTPYKLGEYPGRAMLFSHTQQNWLTATCLGLVGGYAMTVVIIVFGLPAAVTWLMPSRSVLWSIVLTLVLALAAFLILPAVMRRLQHREWKSEQSRQLVSMLARLGTHEALVLIGWSLLRYLCFVMQLVLAMRFCGVALDFSTLLLTLPLYYMLITVTPNVPAAEIAVRGAWAVAVFEPFGADISAAATIAAMIAWAVNTIFPLLVGTVIALRLRQDFVKK